MSMHRPRALAIVLFVALAILSSRHAAAQFTPDVPIGGNHPTSLTPPVQLEAAPATAIPSWSAPFSSARAWALALADRWSVVRVDWALVSDWRRRIF